MTFYMYIDGKYVCATYDASRRSWVFPPVRIVQK